MSRKTDRGDTVTEIRDWSTNKVLYTSENAETLRGAVVEAVAAGADLRGANLVGADLWGANLVGADLRRANLMGADIRRAFLVEADLRGANLRGANLGGANLAGVDLSDANLVEANLGAANLRRAHLMRANLEGANLRIADLWGSDLRRAYLRRAYLGGADLWAADLRDADPEGACLEGANLARTKLEGANLEGTVLDPNREPNGLGDFGEAEDGWCIGYRTRCGQHVGTTVYKDGQRYEAPTFSACPQTACHPGLYVYPTLERVQVDYPDSEAIKVRFRRDDLHQAGKGHYRKWRVRAFEVLGEEVPS